MATRIVKVTGIAEWAKVFEQNRDLTGWKPTQEAEGNYEKYDGACTINMILDDVEVAKLAAAKSPRQPKPDPEGRGMIVKFDRKFNTGYDWSGGVPSVTKSDGSTWDYDSDGSIGNGSTVEVELSVYDTSRPNIVGTRLDKVKVIDHVAYVADTAGDEASPPPVVESEKQSEVLF